MSICRSCEDVHCGNHALCNDRRVSWTVTWSVIGTAEDMVMRAKRRMAKASLAVIEADPSLQQEARLKAADVVLTMLMEEIGSRRGGR